MKKENILVFCAHPDDEVFGPGATIAKYVNEGKNVFTIVFSYGENSHAWLNERHIAKVRERESRKAHKILGGTGIDFFGLKEGNFANDLKEKNLEEKLKKIILQHKPKKVFTHSPDDPHPDHRAASNITLRIIDELNLNVNVYGFDVWNPLNFKNRNNPKLIVDISSTFKIKLKALKCFRSQWMAMTFLLWSVYWRSFMNGLNSNTKYAESFTKIR